MPPFSSIILEINWDLARGGYLASFFGGEMAFLKNMSISECVIEKEIPSALVLL